MTIQACMGGWCRIRERCQHYHASWRAAPRERLCAPGIDGYRSDAPVVFVRPVDRPGLIASASERRAT